MGGSVSADVCLGVQLNFLSPFCGNGTADAFHTLVNPKIALQLSKRVAVNTYIAMDNVVLMDCLSS